MLTLAFDTCNGVVSTAVLKNNILLSKSSVLENSKQAEFLVLEIEKTLKENNIFYQDLDLIATINGPGSFTSVRIGLTCAKTINIAIQKPLILLNSCEVVARKYLDYDGEIIVVNDAKMDEFFIAKFLIKNKKIISTLEPTLIGIDEIKNLEIKNNSIICGSAKNDIAKLLNIEVSLKDDSIEADLVGLLAYEKFSDGYFSDNHSPLYLRTPKIEKRKK